MHDLEGRVDGTHSGEELLREDARIGAKDLVPTGPRGEIELAQGPIEIGANLEEAGPPVEGHSREDPEVRCIEPGFQRRDGPAAGVRGGQALRAEIGEQLPGARGLSPA
jgi:hypothetical protein